MVADDSHSFDARPLVVVVGGSGPVAAAIRRRLDLQYRVAAVGEGDDVRAAAADAAAILVLEAVRPSAPANRYGSALAAVAQAWGDSGLTRIVSVTALPAQTRARAARIAELKSREAPLTDAGLPLAVLRCNSVVGRPDEPGPDDEHLFALPGATLDVRRPGTQQWAPIRIDDLADTVVATLSEPSTAPKVFGLHGAHPSSVTDVLRGLNDDDVEVRPRSRLSWMRSSQRSVVPDGKFVREKEPAPPAVVSGAVALRPVDEGWTKEARERRQMLLSTVTGAAVYRLPSGWFGIYVFLVAVGGACGVVGLHDLFAANDIGVQVTAATLLVASGVMLLACGGLTPTARAGHVAAAGTSIWATGLGAVVLDSLPKEHGGAGLLVALLVLGGVVVYLGVILLAGHGGSAAVAFLGCVSACIVAVILGFSTLASGSPQQVVAGVALAVIACGALAAARLWKVRSLELSHLVAKGAPRAFAGVISVGTLIGFGQFWYQNVHLPNQARPAVNIAADLKRAGEYGKRRHAIAVRFTIENPTDKTVTVLGSHFEVVGLRRRYSASLAASKERLVADRDRPLGRSLPLDRLKVLRTGEVLSPGWYLAPHEKATKGLAILAARSQRVVTVRAHVLIADPRLPPELLKEELYKPDWNAGVIRRSFAINERSIWREVTRGERHLLTVEALHDGPVDWTCLGSDRIQASIEVGPAPSRPSCGPRTEQLARFYGLAWNETAEEVVLKPPAHGKG